MLLQVVLCCSNFIQLAAFCFVFCRRHFGLRQPGHQDGVRTGKSGVQEKLLRPALSALNPNLFAPQVHAARCCAAALGMLALRSPAGGAAAFVAAPCAVRAAGCAHPAWPRSVSSAGICKSTASGREVGAGAGKQQFR